MFVNNLFRAYKLYIHIVLKNKNKQYMKINIKYSSNK